MIIQKKYRIEGLTLITIDDVAKKAGVSIATVSYVINNTKKVSAATRRKVLSVINELNYKPSNIARSLATQSTRMLGVLVSDIADPFFSSIVRGVQNVAEAYGYITMVGNSDEDSAKAQKYIEVLNQHRVDGLIISPPGDTGGVFNTWQADMPLVLVNRRSGEVLSDIVETDNENGAYVATKHLISMGHERIAFISGPTTLSTYADRLLGYRKCLEENQIPVHEELIKVGGNNYEFGYRIVHEIMNMCDKPTAILVASGWITKGVFRALKELKVMIPQEISLLSFDETEWSSLVTPSLTRIAQRTYEMGKNAAKILLKRIGIIDEELSLVDHDKLNYIANTSYYHVKLAPRLIIAESTDRVRIHYPGKAEDSLGE